MVDRKAIVVKGDFQTSEEVKSVPVVSDLVLSFRDSKGFFVGLVWSILRNKYWPACNKTPKLEVFVLPNLIFFIHNVANKVTESSSIVQSFHKLSQCIRCSNYRSWTSTP